jgi:hypothetical protein
MVDPDAKPGQSLVRFGLLDEREREGDGIHRVDESHHERIADLLDELASMCGEEGSQGGGEMIEQLGGSLVALVIGRRCKSARSTNRIVASIDPGTVSGGR